MHAELLERADASSMGASTRGLRINFPMRLLDEETPRCTLDDRDCDHKLSLTDRRVPFLLLYQTLTKLGHRPGEYPPGSADLGIFWTGKHVPDAERSASIVMEVAWLPRWHYQISPTGSNGLGHYAQAYEFEPLGPDGETEIRGHLARMRAQFERSVNPDTVGRLKRDLPSEFLLFPLQLANDFNLKCSGTEFAGYYSLSEDNNVALAQACIDKAAALATSLPVVFKQHPFDAMSGLRDRVRPGAHLVDNRDLVSCHEIFATGRCKGVVSVNSNTVHEAAAWNIPSICLGRLIWNERTRVPPFPASLETPGALSVPPQQDMKVLAYLHYLVRHQWTTADFQNPLMVETLLASRGRSEPAALRRLVGLSA